MVAAKLATLKLGDNQHSQAPQIGVVFIEETALWRGCVVFGRLLIRVDLTGVDDIVDVRLVPNHADLSFRSSGVQAT
jgi:hypothetical protein